MSEEEEPNPTLFFRPFLNTPEGMDVHFGAATSLKAERNHPRRFDGGNSKMVLVKEKT